MSRENPTRGPDGRWRSEGRRKLLIVLQRMTARTLAKACGISPAAVSMLANGTHAHPDLLPALALARIGVPVESWAQAPAVDAPNITPVNAEDAKVNETPRTDAA